ncbi:MAG: protein NrfC [Thermoproteota archaeon]|nr:protein NrfC [Thermoproteota archaeon]
MSSISNRACVYPVEGGFMCWMWDMRDGLLNVPLWSDKQGALKNKNKYLTPVSKAVPSICVQCDKRERECEKACPLTPPVIHFDEKTFSMKVDSERCLGNRCARCNEACTAKIPHFYPKEHDYALVCDLAKKMVRENRNALKSAQQLL